MGSARGERLSLLAQPPTAELCAGGRGAVTWLSRGTALSPSRLWLAASCGPPGHLQPRPGLTSLLLPPGTFRTPH